MLQILDPRAIPPSDFPFIISKGGGIDPVSRLIRWRTHSWCEHSMLSLHPGKLVWEAASSWYGEGSMEKYMIPGNILKFYQLVDINIHAILALENYVANRIASPWWHKLYDWVGIMGEAVGLPKIHTPGLEYCSVDAIHALEVMAPAMPKDAQVVINSIPIEENPGYLDQVMASNPKIFNPYGVYQCIK